MHRALTHGSARALVQPPTRFRAISYRDPTTAATLPVASDDLTCVDWQRVALQESMRVVEWIRYMHQHEHKAVLKLLEALRPAINYGEQRTPQWRNLAITGLPVVLVEILTEDGMFSTTPGAFKDIKYSIAIMSMLALCFRIVVTFDAPQDPNDGDWIFGCLQKRDQLFHTLWNVHYLCRTRRSTIPPDVGMPDLLEHFPFPAYIVVSHMVLLSTETSQRIPLSAHAAHFLLYYWVYTPDASERTSVISQVYAMMKKDMAESIPVFVQQFIAACTAEKSNHLIRFLNEIVPYARGHRTAGGGSAYQYLYVLTALLRYGAETFARIAVSPDYKSVELTQFLIVQCHWQLCCKEGSRDNAEAWKLIFGMLECIEQFISESSSFWRIFLGHLRECTGALNLISTLGNALVHAYQHDDATKGATALQILNFVVEPFHRSDIDRTTVPGFIQFYRTIRLVWHDKLSFMVYSPPQSEIRTDIMNAWLHVGIFFGLQKGVNVLTSEIPSVPSTERRYWKIARVCSRPSCACSAVCHHRLHVCKGCWRVLYCSPTCQALDWKAGHRRVCKTLRDSA